jgi:hypothetical protein
VIHQCTRSRSGQSFQGGCLLGDFLLGHARRRMRALQPVKYIMEFVIRAMISVGRPGWNVSR